MSDLRISLHSSQFSSDPILHLIDRSSLLLSITSKAWWMTRRGAARTRNRESKSRSVDMLSPHLQSQVQGDRGLRRLHRPWPPRLPRGSMSVPTNKFLCRQQGGLDGILPLPYHWRLHTSWLQFQMIVMSGSWNQQHVYPLAYTQNCTEISYVRVAENSAQQSYWEITNATAQRSGLRCMSANGLGYAEIIQQLERLTGVIKSMLYLLH